MHGTLCLQEAKEASITSLQQLLTAKQQALQDQQALWEEERDSLKTAAEVRDIRLADQDTAGQALRTLKARVLELEEESREAGKRVVHLEQHLREREKLLVKAEKRYQDLAAR